MALSSRRAASTDRLDGAVLRQRFARRFAPLWQTAGGLQLGGPDALAERVGEAVRNCRLPPSRARSLAGYLILASAGVPQGSRRTVYELERDCRELGLSFSFISQGKRSVDLATVLDECLAPELWG